MKKILFSLLICLAALPILAQEKKELTIYNQNFALVKDQRYLELTKGVNEIKFTDVAALIEPTSVHFTSITNPDSCAIIEQNYEYDLLSSDKLLSKYIDKNIKVLTQDDRTYDGTLLSFDMNNLVVSNATGLSMITRQDTVNQIVFEKLPQGLITKPTLVWQIDSSKTGKQLTEVSYLTRGINWNCEYVTILNKEDSAMSLDAWVNIDNQSGVTYQDASLKLIAGEVARAQGQGELYKIYSMATDGFREERAPQFEEKGFFEYHIYSLGRPTTIKDRQIKQISLLNVINVPVKKEIIFSPSSGKDSYRYYSEEEVIKQNARVEFEFVNSKQNNLGVALPKGVLKVYKKDDDAALQFVGEDNIDHTAKDEKVRVYIGDAFDVVGERKRTDFGKDRRTMYETYEISLRNHKEEIVKVKVIEKMWRYTNWEITQSSDKWEKEDASTVVFNVDVPKDGEKKVTYTVKYSW